MEQVIKKRYDQISLALGLLVLIILFGYFIAVLSGRSIALQWFFGILLGFVLRQSRFCFTASMRDPVLTGGTSLSKAVIVAIAVASIGFAAVQYKAAMAGLKIPGNISGVGFHVVLGAVIFGIGMVIAGGCASGSLMRMGEGFVMQWLVMVFFIIGSLWGARDYNFWKPLLMDPARKVFLPDVFGWLPALILHFALLLGLFILADWYEKRNQS